MSAAVLGFEKPNYTQIPNAFFDMLPDMKESELKVMLFAIRKTFGWHKESDEISISQFQKGTGLSRQAVINGITEAKAHGTLIELEHDGKRGIKLYKVVIREVDQSIILTSPQSRPVTSQQDGLVTDLTSPKSRHTKESKDSKKQEKKKDNAPKGAGLPSEDQTRRTDLIKAWHEALPELNRPNVKNIYAIKGYHEAAQAALGKGLTPDKLAYYVKAVTYQGMSYHDRVLYFKTACDNAPAWCAVHYRPPTKYVTQEELDNGAFQEVTPDDLPEAARAALDAWMEKMAG